MDRYASDSETDITSLSLSKKVASETTSKWVTRHIASASPSNIATFAPEQDMFLTVEEAAANLEKKNAIWSRPLVEARKLASQIRETQDKLQCRHPHMKMLDPEKFTWDEVESRAADLQQFYEQDRHNTPGGMVRSTLSTIGQHASAFEAWLRVIPQSNNYVAPISGAFQLVLSMGKRMHEVKDGILKALARIPELFADLRAWLHVYGQLDDALLITRAASLLTCIIQVLQNIVDYFGEHQYKKVLGVIFKVDGYEKKLDAGVEEMNDCYLKFKDAAGICVPKYIVNWLKWSYLMDTKRSAQQVDLSRDVVQRLEGLTDEVRHQNVVNCIYAQLFSRLWETSHTPSVGPTAQQEEPSLTVASRELFLLGLAFNPFVTLDQLEKSFQLRAELRRTEVLRLSWIKRSQQFHSWLTSPRSRFLLIEGQILDGSTTYRSPLSYLIAELCHLFEVVQYTIYLPYFCGLQLLEDSSQPYNSKDIIVSFIAQLLSHWDSKTLGEPRLDRDVRDNVSRLTVPTLCAIFQHLVMQLPKPWTIFCFVDNIDIYEVDEREEMTFAVIGSLVDLIMETNRLSEGVVVKLLITAPAISLCIGQEFQRIDDQSRLTVPDFFGESAEGAGFDD